VLFRRDESNGGGDRKSIDHLSTSLRLKPTTRKYLQCWGEWGPELESVPMVSTDAEGRRGEGKAETLHSSPMEGIWIKSALRKEAF